MNLFDVWDYDDNENADSVPYFEYYNITVSPTRSAFLHGALCKRQSLINICFHNYEFFVQLLFVN